MLAWRHAGSHPPILEGRERDRENHSHPLFADARSPSSRGRLKILKLKGQSLERRSANIYVFYTGYIRITHVLEGASITARKIKGGRRASDRSICAPRLRKLTSPLAPPARKKAHRLEGGSLARRQLHLSKKHHPPARVRAYIHV